MDEYKPFLRLHCPLVALTTLLEIRQTADIPPGLMCAAVYMVKEAFGRMPEGVSNFQRCLAPSGDHDLHAD